MSEDTMLERCAKAIDPDAFLPMAHHVSSSVRSKRIVDAVLKVRAVLEVIKEPSEAMVRAALESEADDGEGGRFAPLFDLLDFSGENKTRLVVAEALRASVDAILFGEA